MNIRSLIFLILLLNINSSKGQGLGEPEKNIPNIIPPSPSAAALDKFGTIPVDYSTGVPSISYPLVSWQRNRLSINLGLGYHAGGHKIDDMASEVGLGWALSGVGRISRTVRGVPDDIPVRGFMYSNPLPTRSTFSYDEDYYYIGLYTNDYQNFSPAIAVNEYNITNYGEVKQIADGYMDGEQDIFSYSIDGFSGRFVFDKTQTIIPLEKTNLKFVATYNSSGNIIGFVITDDKGVVYKFNFLETQDSQVILSGTQTVAPDYSVNFYTSSWLISKILDPITQDSISFNYSVNGYGGNIVDYETGFSQSHSYDLEYYNPEDYLSHFRLSEIQNVNSHMLITSNDPWLTDIVLPDGSSMLFSRNFSRADYQGAKALTGVSLKNYRNEIVKQFQLKYSYFLTEPFSNPAWASSGNDFNKRLRLDSIVEVANDNIQIKPTVFQYNDLKLNPRGSTNLDFWGYNVNPSRNNGYYVTEVPLKAQEISIFLANDALYQLTLEGADRKPDPEYPKAAILEKIIYPTGGFTNFEYEANKVVCEINYYDNKIESNTMEWESATFNQTIQLNLGTRDNESIEFYCKIDELSPRPTPTPPYTCFDNSQDIQPASFKITNTSGSIPVNISISDSYANFLAGLRKVIDLPINQDYQVEFIYDVSVSCAYQFPFTSHCIGTYYITNTEKLGGGIRIKKVSTNDGSGNLLTKEYEYIDANGLSSGTLNSVPNYDYIRTTTLREYQNVNNSLTKAMIRQIGRSANPTNTLSYFNGSPLIYTRVLEKSRDGSLIERQYGPNISAPNGNGGNIYYPYLPIQDFPNLSGLLTKQIMKDNLGNIKRDETMTYNKYQVKLSGPNNRNVKTGTIANAFLYSNPSMPVIQYLVIDSFSLYTSRAELLNTVLKNYENGNTMTHSETNYYDPTYHYLKTVKSNNSKNEIREKNLYYAYEFSGGSAYNLMIQNNMLNYVTMSQKTTDPLFVDNVLSQTQTNYLLFQNNSLPMPATVQSSVLGNSLETDITFSDYDDKGNLTEYTGKDGIVTSIIWGYKKQYPVAKISGKSYDNVVSQSNIILNVINEPASESAMRTELDKIRALSGCMATTFTYKPLVGVTSETDANGRTIYYVYDNFNRLSLIRDKDNNILKKFCYNYHNQVTACGYGTTAQWTVISSTCELNAQGQYTGNTIVVEKDINTSSTSYNQTRTVIIIEPNSICVCNGPGKKVVYGICETGVEVCTGSFRNTGQPWQHYYHYQWSDGSISATYTGPGMCEMPLEP